MTLHGLSGNRHFVVLLILAVFFINGVVGTGVSFGLSELKKRDLARAEMQGMAMVQVIRQNIDNSIEKIDIALRMVVDNLEIELKSDQKKNDLIFGVMDKIRYLINESEDVSVTDVDGNVVFHMGHARPYSFNVRDREYFQDIKNGLQDSLYVTRPLKSRLSSDDILIFARGYHDRAGKFAGVVVIPVRIEHFRRQISAFPVPEDSFLSLRSHDLSLIVRNPDRFRDEVVEIGDQSRVPSELREMVGENFQQGTFLAQTPLENVKRIYSVARLSSCQIYIINALSMKVTLDQWRNLCTIVLSMTVIFFVITCLSAIVIFYYWQKEQKKAIQLRLSNDSLQDAIHNLHQVHKSLIAACEVGGLGTYTLDLRNETWIRSPEQEQIFGIPPSYPVSRDAWRRLILDDDRDAVQAYFAEHVCGLRQPFDLEYRILRPNDAAVRWIHGVGKLELDAEGRPIRLIGAVKDVTEAKESQERMAYLAYHDSLTGLPNRILLVDRIHQAVAQAKRHGDLLAVCYLDLDDFKPVNDLFGHDVGDRFLVEVARRLKRATRSGDTVARMGGDEFVVLLCRLCNEAELQEVASRMLAEVALPYTHAGKVAKLTLSIGVSLFPLDVAEEPDALIRHADQALHEAKRKGKNSLCQFDPVGHQRQQEHHAHYARMVSALDNEEFCLYYQPKVDLTSGGVMGAEALIRWQHPERGLLLPGYFLPGVEKTDFTLPLGDWVVRQALKQIRAWKDSGLEISVCINVFGHHLQQPDFVSRLIGILDDFPDVPASSLHMEILETTSMSDLDEVSRRIHDCNRLGITFALDDFGTGYSSLTYFRRLPVKFLKIDRSFVQDIMTNAEDQALVQSMVGMAHALNRKVVAEGVETLAHAVPLRHYGCDIGQGYGIARPMPAEQMPGWVESWRLPDLWKSE